jgi:hypothetical protein
MRSVSTTSVVYQCSCQDAIAINIFFGANFFALWVSKKIYFIWKDFLKYKFEKNSKLETPQN